MPFDRVFLDELSARNDIVDVVSQYVQLKKSGANYFGLCPFHNEKTASFSVSPDKQIFHCFGCGAGGGVITFVMKAEGLEGRLVLQVHDELIVECPEGEADQVCRLVEEEMEGVAALSVPLLAETHAGKSWADAH